MSEWITGGSRLCRYINPSATWITYQGDMLDSIHGNLSGAQTSCSRFALGFCFKCSIILPFEHLPENHQIQRKIGYEVPPLRVLTKD